MKECQICDNSLRFSKGTIGVIVLIAFLIESHWLILATSLLMFFGVFSLKSNILYQFYALVFKKLLKDKRELVQKELGELKFVSGMGGTLLFIGFLLLYFGEFVNFAWIFILITSLLMLLACFGDTCVAALMYLFFKKIFSRLGAIRTKKGRLGDKSITNSKR